MLLLLWHDDIFKDYLFETDYLLSNYNTFLILLDLILLKWGCGMITIDEKINVWEFNNFIVCYTCASMLLKS